MSESRTRLGDILISIVFPPFRGTAVAVWIYFVVCFLMNPHSIILNGNFPDPDDYMYLAQAIDLVKGQGWYDFIQHRLNPPDGTYIHFSRLLCAFYAAPIMLLSRWFSAVAVATVEAAFLPLAFLVLFLGVLKKAARPLAGDDWAGVTAFIALFAGYTIYLFAPGQVDHHGLEALLAIAVFGCLIRPQMKWAALAGFLTAAGPVVGLDFAPVLVLFALWIGIRGVIAGGAAADAAAFFGLALFLSSAGFLLIDRPPPLWLVHDSLVYSVDYVALAAGIAICFLGVGLASRAKHPAWRYIVGALLVLAAGSAFLIAFPEMWHKTFGAVGTELTQRLFDNTDENRPALARYGWSVRFLTLMLWCATGIGFGLWSVVRGTRSLRWVWGLLVFLLIVTTSVGLFYQYRFMYYAQAFNILALAPLLRDGWAWLPRRYQGCPLCAAQLGLILLIGPLPMVLLPALTDGRPFNTGVLLFPNEAFPATCGQHGLDQMLSMPVYYGDRPRLIMNTLNEGPELLFRTPHKVLAGPFHTDTGGNIDSIKFFSTRDPAEAETIIRRRKAELVVLCRTGGYYTAPDSWMIIDVKSGNSKIKGGSFAQQLIDGKVPAWLKPVHSPFMRDMLLFEVVPEKRKK